MIDPCYANYIAKLMNAALDVSDTRFTPGTEFTPIYRAVRRNWRERLFTRPWQPLKATRRERDYGAEMARLREVAAKVREDRRRATLDSLETPVPAMYQPSPAAEQGDLFERVGGAVATRDDERSACEPTARPDPAPACEPCTCTCDVACACETSGGTCD